MHLRGMLVKLNVVESMLNGQLEGASFLPILRYLLS